MFNVDLCIADDKEFHLINYSPNSRLFCISVYLYIVDIKC